MSKFSQRSLDALKGVNPKLVRVLMSAIIDTPYDFTINEGLRTTATQKKYYSWGRTVVNPNTGPLKNKPLGAIVTTKDGVKNKSDHQAKADGFGEAVDLVPFSRDKYGKGFLDWNNDKAYNAIAKHIKAKAKELGIKIRWGGDFKTMMDKPHFELL